MYFCPAKVEIIALLAKSNRPRDAYLQRSFTTHDSAGRGRRVSSSAAHHAADAHAAHAPRGANANSDDSAPALRVQPPYHIMESHHTHLVASVSAYRVGYPSWEHRRHLLKDPAVAVRREPIASVPVQPSPKTRLHGRRGGQGEVAKRRDHTPPQA